MSMPCMPRLITDFAEIARHLKPGSTVVLHSACAEPPFLADQLARCAKELRDVRVIAMMPMGESPYAAPGLDRHLSIITFHPGKGLRSAVNDGRAQLMRTPLSDISRLFGNRTLTADVLLLQTSPPDEAGRMTLGIAVDYMRAVLEQAPVVVAEINPAMPRTCGDTALRAEEVDYIVEAGTPPQTIVQGAVEAVDRLIAGHIAGLIRSGAVIQTGIGSIPDLVLGQLAHLYDLGIHSGIITDALKPMLERGVVTNASKTAFRGRCVTTMAAGTQDFYDFLHGNCAVEFHPSLLTHDFECLASIERLCAINSVLQIDLPGQANAERIDGRIIASPGGLPDFARGASAAKTGMSIIALRSTSRDGQRSNILSRLPAGSPVTIDAPHIDYVVTEHGAARLRGLDLAARARALIAVAHPEHRADLRRGVGPAAPMPSPSHLRLAPQ